MWEVVGGVSFVFCIFLFVCFVGCWGFFVVFFNPGDLTLPYTEMEAQKG